jgi:hypothetical protein
VESIAPYNPPFQDGLIRDTETQTLDYGLDPTFDAWQTQMLARFRDDLRWYHSEQRKLEYMLSRISRDAQVHMNTGIKNKLLPRFFQTVQDALVCLQQALTNPYVL